MENQTHTPIGHDLALEIVALSVKCGTYIAGGTLDRHGKRLPVSLAKAKMNRKRRRPYHGRNEAAMARRSILGLYEFEIASGLTSDAHITGRTLPHFRLSEAQVKEGEWGEPDIEFVEQRGHVLTRRTVLSVPIRRHRKIVSKKGETTFHLRIYSISKTNADANPSATLKRAGSHSVYITRESALAKDLLEPEVITKGDAYVTRPSVVPVSVGDRQLLFTNISADAREREEFWEAVVERERTPGPEAIHVDLDRCRPLLGRIASAPDCPKKFVEELAKTGSKSGACKLKTGSNAAIRKILERMDEPIPPEVASKGQKRLTNAKILKEFGFAFSTPRGGRVQMRMEAELPAELSLEQMELVLRGMCAILDRKGLPYIGVLHRPDENNHEKNWHFHILSYDRPVERFTGPASTLLPLPPSNAGAEELERHSNLQASAAKVTANRSSKQGWDFEIKEHYRSDCGHKRVRYPFEQPKDRTVNNKVFVKSMRKAFSDLCNEQLEVADSGRRFHPGSFADLGIPKKPDVKLSSNANRLEKFGVPTRQGVENERNQSAYHLATFMQQRQQDLNALRALGEDWLHGVRGRLSPQGENRFAATLSSYENIQRRIADKNLFVSIIADTLDRATSRANAVIANTKKAIMALHENKLDHAKLENRAQLLARMHEAKSHRHATLQHFNADFQRWMELESEINLDTFLAEETRRKLDQAEAIERSLDQFMTYAINARKNIPQANAKIAAEMAKIDVRLLPALTELEHAHDAIQAIVDTATKQRLKQPPEPAVVSDHPDNTTPAQSRLVSNETPASFAASREGNAAMVADRGGAAYGHASSHISEGKATSQERFMPPGGKVDVPQQNADVCKPVGNVESATGASSPPPAITTPTASRAADESSSTSRSPEDAGSAPEVSTGIIASKAGQPRTIILHPSMIASKKTLATPKSNEAATGAQTGSPEGLPKEQPHGRESADDADRVKPNSLGSDKAGADTETPPSDVDQLRRRDLTSELASLGDRLNRERSQREPSNPQPDISGGGAAEHEPDVPAAGPSNGDDTTVTTGVNSEVALESSPRDETPDVQCASGAPHMNEGNTSTAAHTEEVGRAAGEIRPAKTDFAVWWETTLPRLRPLFDTTPALACLADAKSKGEADLMVMFAKILRDDVGALRSIEAVDPRVIEMLKHFAKHSKSTGGPVRNEPEFIPMESPVPPSKSIQKAPAKQRPSEASRPAPDMAQATKWRSIGIGLLDEWHTATKNGKTSRAEILAFEFFDRKLDHELAKLNEVWRRLITQDRQRYLDRKKARGREHDAIEPTSLERQELLPGDRLPRVDPHTARPTKPPPKHGVGGGKDPAGAEGVTGRG